MKFYKSKLYQAGFTDHFLTYQCHDSVRVIMRDEEGELHSIDYHKTPLWEWREPEALRVEKFHKEAYDARLVGHRSTLEKLLTKYSLKLVDKDD